MCLGAAYHLVYLLATPRGRAQLRALRPRLRDAGDAFRLVFFNLGLARSRPRFDRFSYQEKLEYWAVVWGTVVMAATGFLMWFQTRVLADAPLWSLDLATVIHYYEAWLATLAIVVWHLYGVIFRVDVYPMSWVWLSGRLSGRQMAEEHPVELDAILGDEAAAEPPGPGRPEAPK
jgi:cytochrome b subunit of formate dehydrogenase